MTKKDNIIQFPTPEMVSKKEAEQILNIASDECVGLSQHCCDILVEEISADDYFSDAEFFDETHSASRDLYTITNLINAMLLRHLEIPHELQRSLDQIYIKVKQMAQLPLTDFEIDFFKEENEDDEDNLPEIHFEPDFDLTPPENKDDS
tara:strand:+ start:3510 stop:3956 length:447 start_codon:yes stop_codon:yes gene_type:complete